MHTFRHPVFLVCAAVFLLHQLTQKAWGITLPFADSYLDNLLCLPLLLSMLLAERRWWWRQSGYSIPFVEVAIITLILSLLFELAFPHWSPHFTADYWDVAAYATGAGLFSITVNK